MGVKIAVFAPATYVTVPATAAPPVTATLNVPAAVIVAGFIAWLKVAVILWFKGTLPAPFAGIVAVTAGTNPVMKLHI